MNYTHTFYGHWGLFTSSEDCPDPELVTVEFCWSDEPYVEFKTECDLVFGEIRKTALSAQVRLQLSADWHTMKTICLTSLFDMVGMPEFRAEFKALIEKELENVHSPR